MVLSMRAVPFGVLWAVYYVCGVLWVRCIMGGGKAAPSAGASFAREYDSGTWWRQLTEGGPPAKTVAPSLALSRI